MPVQNRELLHSSLPGLPPPKVGKVREVYDLGSELLIVATDRISAFDSVMANGIPQKGAILNQLSAFWFEKLAHLGAHHLITIADHEITKRLGEPHPELAGRCVIAKKAKPIMVECVARGYITGSLYKDYLAAGANVHGLDLPTDLLDGSRLPEVIFTPAHKAQEGHDENMSYQAVVDAVGADTALALKERTLALYSAAVAHAEQNGIIIADTKFEFGWVDGELTLIDEVLTPDSSRFWEKGSWKPGQIQPSYDKQFVREYLKASGWDQTPPGPSLPPEVVEGTRSRYEEAFQRLTGRQFQPA